MKKLLVMLLIAAGTLAAQAQTARPQTQTLATVSGSLDSLIKAYKTDLNNTLGLFRTATGRADSAAIALRGINDKNAKQSDSIKALYAVIRNGDSVLKSVRDSVQMLAASFKNNDSVLKIVRDSAGVLDKKQEAFSSTIDNWPAYKFGKEIKIDAENNFIIDPQYFEKIKTMVNASKIVLSFQTQ